MKSFDDFADVIWADTNIRDNAVDRAQRQMTKIFHELNHQPKDVLSLSKNAASFSFEETGKNVVYDQSGDQFDTLLGLDEAFTYCNNEDQQRQYIYSCVKKLKKDGLLLCSVRDYRNNPFHKRPLGDTGFISTAANNFVVVEANSLNTNNNQQWNQYNYIIEVGKNTVELDLGSRRTLYFKQLAKYCHDAGCKQFGVIREQFWRSPWRRSMEHIVWARF